MGLDQTFFASEKEYPLEDVMEAALDMYEHRDQVDYDDISDNMESILDHWLRKVPALHRYYENLAYEKLEGTIYEGEGINSIYVLTTKEELLHLKTLCLVKGLEEDASGFFWGTHHDDHYAEIITAVDAALEAIEEGKYIYYYGNY